MTDTPPGALERFTAPIPVRVGEDADRSAEAWEEYRLTGDAEALIRSGDLGEAMTMHDVGWRDGDDAFLAFGSDPDDLPVFRVVGAVKSPDALIEMRLR